MVHVIVDDIFLIQWKREVNVIKIIENVSVLIKVTQEPKLLYLVV